MGQSPPPPLHPSHTSSSLPPFTSLFPFSPPLLPSPPSSPSPLRLSPAYYSWLGAHPVHIPEVAAALLAAAAHLSSIVLPPGQDLSEKPSSGDNNVMQQPAGQLGGGVRAQLQAGAERGVGGGFFKSIGLSSGSNSLSGRPGLSSGPASASAVYPR